MRENFSHVSIEDYSRDMAESASRAAGIIDVVKSKQREAERVLIAAVLAAGGQLEISAEDMIDADRALLRIERRASDEAMILTVRR